MTPEHLSELQNILAFLRENELKQSEASLIVEVQGLMEAAERERDRATRRDQGNNDDDADDPSEGAEAHPSSPSRALGRFGSNIEQTFAAMGEDLDARESDDDGSSVDTFATPAGDVASRVAASVEDDDDERDVARDSDDDISAAAFAHARDDVPRAPSPSPPPSTRSPSKTTTTNATSPRDSTTTHPPPRSRTPTTPTSPSPPKSQPPTPDPRDYDSLSASSSCVGSMNPDEFHALANEWQTRPLEEYDEDEDPGYAAKSCRRRTTTTSRGARWTNGGKEKPPGDAPRPSEMDETKRETEKPRGTPRARA